MGIFNREFQKQHGRFEEIHDKYIKYVYKIADANLNDKRDVEDAVQECFTRIFRNIDKIYGMEPDHAKAYIQKIMENTYRDIQKNNNQDVTISLDDEFNNVDGEVLVCHDEAFARAEMREEIDIYLKILNEEELRIMELKFYRDWPDKQISELLLISDSALRKKLERIKKRLRQHIENLQREEANEQ